jgi:hypothetical protein
VDRFVAIETSNAPGSIALFEDARLLSYHEGSAENAQGESILAVLSQALEQAQWSKKTVKTWVVGLVHRNSRGARDCSRRGDGRLWVRVWGDVV